MNWTTIAPESRLYKGKELYRWDVSPGLDHHCGICATPLHNSRAKSSCIGKHVEPCYRFHQQLHFIGRSHECKGCNHADEMHHNRHKEILILTRKINDLDELSNPDLAPSNSPSLSKSGRGSTKSSTTSIRTPSEVSSDIGEDGPKMRTSNWKKAKRTGFGLATKKTKVEVFSKEDTDFISEAIHLSIHDTKGGWHGTSVYNSKQPEGDHSMTEDEEVECIISQTTNLSVKVPITPNLTPRQRRNDKKCSTMFKQAGYRGGSRRFSPNGISKDPFNDLDPQIFFRLNIEVDPAKNPVPRKELVAKLVAAVKSDLAILAQEDAESDIRAEGFWRWAGKSAWVEIMRRREELDWATGQKIDARRKEARYDYPDFVEHGTDAGIPDGIDTTAAGHPVETFADDDSPDTTLQIDFSVKAENAIPGKERIKKVGQEWDVATSSKHTAKKRRTGGRAFVTKSVGGNATLRMTTNEECEMDVNRVC